MRRIPVDQSRLRILSAGPPAPATQPDGSPRLNRAGQALTNVPVLVLAEGGRAESLTVRVPSPAPALPELAPLRFGGLVAWYWTLDNGRSGISLTADTVEVIPVRADVTRAPSAPSR
jgi:hypothetical protein